MTIKRVMLWQLTWAVPAALISIASFLPGSDKADGNNRFIPSSEVARAAVERGMKSWMDGEPVGPIPGTSPVIEVVDSYRKPGQKILRYEVLGEVAGNAPRCFAVRAYIQPTPDAPEQVVRMKYLVIGIDPLWVFRHEDLDMLSHWEHHMGIPKSEDTTKETSNK